LAEINTVLEVKDVSVSYGRISAIRNITLEVNEDEIVALIGANGAGKSTLLKALLGIHRCNHGSIFFEGQDITRRSTSSIVASGITFVPEGGGVLPLMTVIENLQLGAYHLKGDINSRLRQVFERFPVLKERRDQKASTLSGGERQMLAIGRALMATPKLLMLDEPSLGLSPIMVVEVFNIIAELKKENLNILLSEQNAIKALGCADRGYVFETGNLILASTAQDLLNNQRIQQVYLGGT